MSVSLSLNPKNTHFPEMETPSSKRQKMGQSEDKFSTKRLILALDSIPSYSDSMSDSDENPIVKHAAMRVELIYQALVLYFRKGLRTDGTQRNFDVSVSSARMQVGQSHTPGYHAAHSFPASGVIDTLWDTMCQEVALEKDLTPQKRQVLAALKTAHFKLQSEIFDTENIVSHLNHGIKKCLFSDTPSEVLLNRTNIQDTGVNLGVDKGLEKYVRESLISEIFKRSAYGEEPHVLTRYYVQKTRQHFETKIIEFNKRIAESKTSTQIQKISKALEKTKSELLGTKEPRYELLVGKFDHQSQQLKMVTGDNLFKRSLELLAVYDPQDLSKV